jgi:hypothetical protein
MSEPRQLTSLGAGAVAIVYIFKTHDNQLALRVTAFHGPGHYRDASRISLLVEQALAALRCLQILCSQATLWSEPNWVKEHDERWPGPNQWEHVITHPAVIEAVVRWVAERLQGRGQVTICDGPQTDSSFATLSKYCGFEELLARCRKAFPGVDFCLLDLRPEEWHAVDSYRLENQVARRSARQYANIHKWR